MTDAAGERTPRTIVVTGGSDGIGAAAVRGLHAAGHRVVLVGRRPAKTAALADELGVDAFTVDYADLADVVRLAGDLRAAHPRIDVLANNAGTMIERLERTGDGFEHNFQLNHLAPFLLTRLLLDRLVADRASIVFTTSAAATGFGRLDVDDLPPADPRSPMRAYASAKLAGLAIMLELHRRHHAEGLSTAAFHPGAVATNFGADGTGLAARFYRSRLKDLILASPEKGAAPLVRLAGGSPGVDWESGTYYHRHRPRELPRSVTADAAARDVWARTEELVAPYLPG